MDKLNMSLFNPWNASIFQITVLLENHIPELIDLEPLNKFLMKITITSATEV
jgi:hypothetical protein